MRSQKRLFAVMAVVVLLLGAVVAGLLLTDSPVRAFAQDISGAEEDALEGRDEPVTGEALERASEAALQVTGEGRVTGTEVGDEEGYYEIEITLDNGQQVDVHLDENFAVLGQEDDGAGEDD
jgi:hypothetical protein